MPQIQAIMLHLSLRPAQGQGTETTLPQNEKKGNSQASPRFISLPDLLGHQGQAASQALGVGPLFLQKAGFCVWHSHKAHSRPSGIFAVFCSPFYQLWTPVLSATKARGPVPHEVSTKLSTPLLQVAWCLHSGSPGAYPQSRVCLCPVTAFRQAGRFLMPT